MNKLADQEIFNKALEQFKNITGAGLHPVDINNIEYIDGHGYIVRFEFRRGVTAEYFTAFVYPNLTKENLGAAEQRVRTCEGKGIVVAKYVNPQMTERLREKQINFMDTTGNIFLDAEALYVFVKGNKPKNEIVLKVTTHRVFRPGGLKVIFALLCNPGLEKAPLREIALRGGVALGTVGTVLQGLKDLGFLYDMGGKGRLLKKKKQLLDKWVEEYPLQLMPKQRYGHFTATDDDWLENIYLKRYKAVWGGETAAALLTGYLKPQNITIYTGDDPGKLIIENRLRKDPGGDIEIRNTFWDFTEEGETTPPILIYADLLATGDTRNIETAQSIYDQAIIGLIDEDR